ncbi:nucleotidyltransferase domain-containing protein [Candidatus Woesearchaeota archaeon]|nr:nucleotidyltransferase domain-containing protein [Candidatus Woesearchaeota archaeon]
MKLLSEVISKIKPKEGSFDKEIKEVVSKINSELKKNKIKAETVVGGSFAKDTHLVGDHDCDIFVRFDYKKYKETDLSELLEKALKQFKAERVHGSRDYFQFKKSLNYEIVPVLKINKASEAVNVTDASPLHVAWSKKHKMSDEIRLAKAFCKAYKIYGAESYIKGFSGHVLDILTIYYGSFIKLLKASQKWKDKTVIDIQKYHDDALFELNTAKTQSPLIVVDPIQKDRNAAAALSYEAVDVFKKKASEFLKKPSAKFFEKHVMKKEDLKDALIIDVVPQEGKNDIVATKVLKVIEELERQLKKNDFVIKSWGWEFAAETFIWFKLKNEKLSAETIVEGPPVKIEKHAEMFKKAYKSVFEKKGRLYAKTKRKYVNSRDLIKDVLNSEYVKERVERARLE